MTGAIQFVATAVSDKLKPQSVAIEFTRRTDISSRYFQGVWDKLADAIANCHSILEDAPPPPWASWTPDEWGESTGSKRQSYIAWDGPIVAGFLNLMPNVPSAVSPENTLMYVERLAVFPGNNSCRLWNRRLKFVGAALVGYAVKESLDQGFDGAVGLHSEDADGFYDSLSERSTGRLWVKREIGVKSGVFDGDENYTYFEASAESSKEFLEGFRHDPGE